MTPSIDELHRASIVVSLNDLAAVAGISGSNIPFLVCGLVIWVVAIVGSGRIMLAFIDAGPWVVHVAIDVFALTANEPIIHGF